MAAEGHGDLFCVFEVSRQVWETVWIRIRREAAGSDDRIADAQSRGQRVETRGAHRPTEIDDHGALLGRVDLVGGDEGGWRRGRCRSRPEDEDAKTDRRYRQYPS